MTSASSVSSSHLPRTSSLRRSVSESSVSPSFLSIRTAANPRNFQRLVVSSSASSSFQNSGPSKWSLASLVQEIEPLDVSLIQKDVSPTTVDAIKRTISGMLGLLPSDRFQVSVEALWKPLSNLLVSSMMTGYTLRNAEYRLCLERNLDMSDEFSEARKSPAIDALEVVSDGADNVSVSEMVQFRPESDKLVENSAENDVKSLGELTTEAHDYIGHLESRLSSLEKELRDVKRKSAALQIKQLIGEEKNDLLNYLRSLEPEKVAELSEPTHLMMYERQSASAPPSDNTMLVRIVLSFLRILHSSSSLSYL